MKREQLLFFVLFLLYTIPAFAQVDTAWVRRYDAPAHSWDEPIAVAVDKSGNVYVTGFSERSETYRDFTTISYCSNGELRWIKLYDGPANGPDEAKALAVDDQGNVYVTGFSSGGGYGGYINYVTIKYASTGFPVWVNHYNGFASALTLDDSGNVYVTGNVSTIKYSPSGDTVWTRRIEAGGYAIAVDKNKNVYVCGDFWNQGSVDYLTIKFAPNGDTLWVRSYNGPGDGLDAPGDFYFPTHILAVDRNGNVYVTGKSDGGGFNFDYATIKYSPDGDTLWVRRYNGPADSNDFAKALAVDDSGNVYVTGVSRGIGTSDDIATIKYSPNGDVLWVRRYDGPNGWDGGKDLVLDKKGNVYVTGYSRSLTLEDFITIKYAPNGDILWSMRYNGPVDSNDVANAIAIDDNGNVYVTGRSIGSNTYQNHDYTTVKYVQYNCLAKPGDVDGDNQILLSDIVTLINTIFKGTAFPSPFCRADVNVDGKILLSDIVYLINYLYKSGPAPVKNRECCL